MQIAIVCPRVGDEAHLNKTRLSSALLGTCSKCQHAIWISPQMKTLVDSRVSVPFCGQCAMPIARARHGTGKLAVVGEPDQAAGFIREALASK